MADEPQDEKPIGAHAKHFAEPVHVERATTDQTTVRGGAAATGAAERADARESRSDSQHGASAPSTKSKRNKALIAVIIVCLIVAAGAGGYVWHMNQLEQQRAQEMAKSDKPATKVKKTGKSLPANPIDFASLIQENSDIYAWLYIPGADINTPLLQSQTDDLFYLDHDKDGKSDPYGTAFTQMANKRDFSDPVTVAYGHVNGGVFHNLHDFEDADFFKKNKEFYIYTPGHIKTYEVIAAYQYDDRHILNSFNFADESVRQQYFDSVLNPESLNKNVREGVTLNADSKIVQLSTCMLDSSQSNSRYIVTGLLTNDQETK